MMTADDKDRVRQCLMLVEQAQGFILTACSTLSPVKGFGDQWSALCDSVNVIRERWYEIEARRNELKGGGQ